MKIAILIPVCSRNQTWKTYEECYFANTAWPSLVNTLSPEHDYTIYIGIDEDDEFFKKHVDRFPGQIVWLQNCQGAPAHAWNQLFERAFHDGHDYFFQMADDVELETTDWTRDYIETLQANNNLGVVGPCHLENLIGRNSMGKPFVLENAFVHRRHYEIFGTFYDTNIRNWYCDDWITRIYDGWLSKMCMNHTVKNKSISNPNQRYEVETPEIEDLIDKGRTKIAESVKGCFSFCLFGPYSDKYYKGLEQNVKIIRKHYPKWAIRVYVSAEAESFVRALGVTCIPTGVSGWINMVYRFYPVLDTSFDVVCVRDTDSRIHERDRWCIKTFLEGPCKVYTIRDHPWHRYKVMGGLWGAKPSSTLFKKEDLDTFCNTMVARYTDDCNFLQRHLNTQDLQVFCYQLDGLAVDLTERVTLISQPGDFCGNVILFDENGKEFPQFIRRDASMIHWLEDSLPGVYDEQGVYQPYKESQSFGKTDTF